MASIKNSLDAFREESEKTKNKTVDQTTTQLRDKMLETGNQLKNKFMPWLSNLQNMLKMLGDLPFLDKLRKLLENFLNSQISGLINKMTETMQSGWAAIKHLATASIERLIDTVVSHLSVPDEVYLAGIKPLYAIGSNLSYKSDYARNIAIKMDFVKTLKWIDGKLGIKYGLIDSTEKSKTNSTLSNTCSGSCVLIFDYIFEQLKAENNIVLSNLKSYEAQIKSKNADIETINALIDSYNDEYGLKETTEIRREEINVLIGLEKINIKNIEKEISELNKAKKIWDNYDFDYKQTLAKYFKNLMVYSVGNLNADKIRDYTQKYNIIPAWFGDYDPLFNGKFKFTSNEVNIMAPFYNGNGFNKQIKSDLGDTRLVKTSKLPKYITLRNVFLKKIYILMNSINIYGTGNQLSSQVLYERLSYNTMDFFTQLADEALGYMIDDGLGKLAIDTLLNIESAIYDYTKKMERAMTPPTQKEYFQRMSYLEDIPVPIIPYDDEELGKDPNLLDPTNNKLSPNELKNLIHYYLRILKVENKYKPLNDLYNKFKDMYENSGNNEEKKIFYQKFILSYFSIMGLEPKFIYENYAKTLNFDYIRNSYTSIMDLIYYKKYKNIFGFVDDSTNIPSEMNEIFINNYRYLRHIAIDDMVDSMSEVDIYSNLLLVYNVLGEFAIRSSTDNATREELLNFIRKHYTIEAYTTNFKIQIYLNMLSATDRSDKLKEVLKDLDEQCISNEIFKKLKSLLINAILLQIYPSYGAIIKIEEGSDIDINDSKVKSEIESEYEEYWKVRKLIKDFDNKLWTDTMIAFGEDLNDTEFKPDKKLDYVVYFNPNI